MQFISPRCYRLRAFAMTSSSTSSVSTSLQSVMERMHRAVDRGRQAKAVGSLEHFFRDFAHGARFSHDSLV